MFCNDEKYFLSIGRFSENELFITNSKYLSIGKSSSKWEKRKFKFIFFNFSKRLTLGNCLMAKLLIDNIFEICNIPNPNNEFRVAYNIWKPFVFKREVVNYSNIAETKAEILDGIDIQV